MLAKHSLLYVLARGFPGLINFSALAIYTRLLTPGEYGQYAIVIAMVGLFNMLFFEWLHLGLLRYLPAKIIPKPVFLSTIRSILMAIGVPCVLIGICCILFNVTSIESNVIVAGLVLLLVTGLFNLNLQLKSAQLLPLAYGKLTAGKSIMSLAAGTGLVYSGFGVIGLLSALSLGMLVSLALWAGSEWQGLEFRQFDKDLLRKLLSYGLPLSLNLAMAEIISSSDRFFLNWMQNQATTGLYAVGYDLASQVLGVILMILNLAAYPLAVRALERQGEGAARRQLRKNYLLIIGIVFPASVGLAILAPGITHLLIGEEFQQTAQVIVPWVSLAALLAGLKSYYFDMAFQLGQKTVGQLKVLVTAALINLMLNYLLIPEYSVMGAIYATIIAYALGLCLSAVSGRKYFNLPLPKLETLKILFAALIMGLIIWPFQNLTHFLDLVVAILLGCLVYLLMMLTLNIDGIGDHFNREWARRFSYGK